MLKSSVFLLQYYLIALRLHFVAIFLHLFFNSQFSGVGFFENFFAYLRFFLIIQWVTSGVIAVWGPIDSAIPPQLVLPLTVEPSKPRLCHDERYLNLWIRDLPFKLDHLCDLPRYVLPGRFQTTVAIRPVISMFWFILRLKLTSASSGMASFSSYVHSRLDGKLVRSCTINSDSWFRGLCGLLGFRFRNTLMIGTLDSFCNSSIAG